MYFSGSKALAMGLKTFWAAGKEYRLSYHNPKTLVFPAYPFYIIRQLWELKLHQVAILQKPYYFVHIPFT